MPTQVMQMLLVDESQLHPTILGIGPQNHQMIANMVAASIAVQPPSQASTAQILYPPVIAQQSLRIEPDAQYFATAVLLNDGGSVMDGCLEGTKAASGFQLDESSGSSTMVYAFPNLSISRPGSYHLRVDLYKMSTAGSTLMEQLEANTIAVSSSDVPHQEPSSQEQALMRGARNAGVPIPSP